MYSKEFNNCYILLSNISQALENTKFIAGELSLHRQDTQDILKKLLEREKPETP